MRARVFFRNFALSFLAVSLAASVWTARGAYDRGLRDGRASGLDDGARSRAALAAEVDELTRRLGQLESERAGRLKLLRELSDRLQERTYMPKLDEE